MNKRKQPPVIRKHKGTRYSSLFRRFKHEAARRGLYILMMPEKPPKRGEAWNLLSLRNGKQVATYHPRTGWLFCLGKSEPTSSLVEALAILDRIMRDAVERGWRL